MVAADAKRVHVVFVGAGAVGCFYASRLHHPQHNVNVSLIARSNYKALTDSGGVSLRTRAFGDYAFHPQAVYPSVTEAAAAGHAWDFIVVTTKALPDRSDDSALVAPLVGPSSTIVLIQNGVGVEHPYRSRFPSTPVVSGVTVISAEQIEPGVVRQNRWTRLHLGPYTNSAAPSVAAAAAATAANDTTDEGAVLCSSSSSSSSSSSLTTRGTQAVHDLADWWTRLGGIKDVEPLDELALQTVRWHKLCINAAFNPSAVLSGGRGNADMAVDSELRHHLRGIMEEIATAAPRILGTPFPDSMAGPEKILASTERNAGALPSMLLDWSAGRPMELEVILGNPVRIARAKGVELPRMQSLYALLRSAQAMREKERERNKSPQGKL